MTKTNQLAVFRFAVGSEEGPRSASFRVWATPKCDVYASARRLGGTVKVSLHSTGPWQYSFTEQFYDAKARGWIRRPSRHIFRWQRPAEIAPGVTLALRVIVPDSELTPFGFREEGILWLPRPGDGCVVEVNLFLLRPATRITGWPGRRSMGTELLGSAVMSDGGTMWLVWACRPLPQGLMDKIALLRERLSREEPVRRGALDSPGIRAVVFGDEPDGSKVLVDVDMRMGGGGEPFRTNVGG